MEAKSYSGKAIVRIENYSKNAVWVEIENRGGSSATAIPLSRLRNLVNNFPPRKPIRLEKQLYDALENLICQLYADGPTSRGIVRANRALEGYTKIYGMRHGGKDEKQ